MRIHEIIGKITGGSRRLDEGRKYVPISKRQTIAVDTPHVKGQQVHAHLDETRVVNKDGSRSHGNTPFHMTKAEEEALLALNFDIPKSRLIESEGNKVDLVLRAEIIDLLIRLRQFVSNRPS